MVLVGYHSSGGYKWYDSKHKKIVINRDVVIDASKSWDWNIETKKGSTRMLIDLNNVMKLKQHKCNY